MFKEKCLQCANGLKSLKSVDSREMLKLVTVVLGCAAAVSLCVAAIVKLCSKHL